MSYGIDKSLRIRFLLDAYVMDGATLRPVPELYSHSFSTRSQAEKILEIANRAKDLDGNALSFKIEKKDFENTTYNYRDSSDPDNLYAFTIECDFTFKGQPGHLSYRVGDLIAKRILNGKTNSTTLVMDQAGQLDWA